MPPAVVIDGVHKHYPHVHALRGVSLDIRQGEFFGLLGPNGAGKSTLINLMAGLTRLSAGRIRVMGYDVVKDYRQARRSLGVVPQELVFDPFFTVREVLRIQAGYFGLGKENEPWREELIAALMLTDKANTNMRALSGGMKRRVLIAQALVHKPQVVVLDEPTAGVDVELRRSLWAFIKRLHTAGHTVLLTTHYLEEAESLCDRIGILHRGQVVALDSKQALLKRGLHTTLWVTTAEPLAADLPALRGRIKSQQGNRLELRLDQGAESIIEVLEAVKRAGAAVTDLRMEEANLEDVFLEITGKRR